MGCLEKENSGIGDLPAYPLCTLLKSIVWGLAGYRGSHPFYCSAFNSQPQSVTVGYSGVCRHTGCSLLFLSFPYSELYLCNPCRCSSRKYDDEASLLVAQCVGYDS